MRLPFSLFLAARYLRPKRTFVSIITLISVLGVTLGVAVLIIVISVMTGFGKKLEETILGFEPHLVVRAQDYLDDWRPLADRLAAVPGVRGVAPFVQGPVLLEFQGRVHTPVMRGIDVEKEKALVDLAELVKKGEGTVEMGSDQVIMGISLARELGVQVGDKVTIYAPGNINAILDELKREEANPTAKSRTLAELKKEVVLPADLEVVGLFKSGRHAYDSSLVLTPLHMAQELYLMKDSIHGLSVQTTSADQAGVLQKQLLATLPPELNALTWYDNNADRLDAVRLERSVMFTILMFLIVIAAFGIINTLITVTVQKRREIGILKALGASMWQIVWVFMGQGVLVGFFGTLIGLGAGMFAVHFRNEFREWLSQTLGIVIFPPTIYEFDGIPAEIVPGDIATICIAAFVICSIGAFLPAWSAARLDPVKALRYE